MKLSKLLVLLAPLTLFAQMEAVPEFSFPETEIQFSEPLQHMPLPKKYKSPALAVLFSTFIPGSGHYYLGDYRTASELLGSTFLSAVGIAATANDPELFFTSIITTQAVSMYGIYAAYRDTSLYNGNPLATMPRDNIKNLIAAPFQWSILKKPEVWGGCLGAIAVAGTVMYFAHAEKVSANTATTYITPLNAFPVAIGEESFFRGFLQPALNANLPDWCAITLSSLVFGAAHIPNAFLLEPSEQRNYFTFSLPLITSIGAYLGWLSHKNRSIKECVAIHAWYDFAIFATGALANRAFIGGKSQFHHSWQF